VAYHRLSRLYRSVKKFQQAREYELKDLGIAERLANGEPERADFQIDLAVSLARVGAWDEDDHNERLQRALTILVALKDHGQLSQADEPKIAELRKLMRARGTS